MVAMQDWLVVDVASRDRYSSLAGHLLSVRPEPEWRTTFGELEAILGYRPPDTARLHRPLWAITKVGSGHGHSFLRQETAWPAREADINADAPVFAYSAGTHERFGNAGRRHRFNLDRDFPPWDPGPWPEGFTVSRDQIYDDRGRLTGGPEDIPAHGR